MPRRAPTRRLRAAPLIALAALATPAALPAVAHAHAAFLGATPAPGARVQAAPQRIVLRFTEPLNRRLSGARLLAARGGRRIPAAAETAGARDIALRPSRPLEHGAYRVEWHTVSTDDGHELEGSFGFGVRVAPGAGAQAIEQSPFANLGWLRALLRVLLYAALLPLAGALLLAALLGRDWLAPPGLGPAAAGRRASDTITDLGVFAAALAAAAAVVDAARAANGVSAAALNNFLLANLSGVGRLAVIVLAGLAAALARRRPRLAALAAAGALGAVVLSGHADSAPARGLALATDWVHLLGAAVWVGGIGAIALVWAPALRRRAGELRLTVAREVLVPFGRVALPAFVVAVLAGIVNAAVELHRVSDLWETSYGSVLAVKVVLVAALGAASYVHALRLRPRLLAANPHPAAALERRHWRLVRIEPLLGLGVVAAVGLLAAFPLPPRQLGEAAGARASVPACAPCPLPLPAPDELSVASQGGSTVVAGWLRRRPGAVTGTLRLLDFRDRPSRARARVLGASQSSCGRGCLRFTAPGAPRELRVAVTDARGTGIAVLPGTWDARASRRPHGLLGRAEARMRGLRSLRQVEDVTSGPGTFARTRYVLAAPDRLAFVTDRGVRGVTVGARQYQRAPGGPWLVTPTAGGAPFRTASWFRYTPYAAAVRVLSRRRTGGRTVVELALADPTTPVWSRLTIDADSGLVLSDQLVTPGRFVVHRNAAFGAPVTIATPKGAVSAG